MPTIIEELSKKITGEILSDEKTLVTYGSDKSPFRITPYAVFFPKTVKDVSEIVTFIAANKDGHPELSITARAAGSDLTGGPLNESFILAFEKYFTNFSFSGETAKAQPGVYYRDFDKESLAHNLILPSYPASRDLCAIGGMTANNSGGEKTLAYGKTADYVIGLDVVLDDGSLCTFSKLNRSELETKLKLTNREGEIYRAIHALITKNYEKIINAKPHVSKNSAGYALWDVWDPHADTFDLTRLIVGSQGTLCIITDVAFRLIKPKPLSQMLAIFVDDISMLPPVVKTVLAQKPEAFEVYDKTVLNIIFKSLPSFFALMGGNIFKMALDFLPEFKIIVSTGKIPNYILTAEFTGDDASEILKRLTIVADELKKLGVKSHITRGPNEIKKYHTIRRQSFSLLQNHHKDRQTVTFFDDLIVLPEKLPEFIPAIRKILDSYPSVAYSIFGHIGDGNFHIVPLMDLSDPKSRDIIEKLTHEVNDLILSFHGSITAEHNDGLVRSPFLQQMYGDDIYHLFEQTKEIFDPKHIFNPHKKVHTHLSYALDHLKTSQ